MRFPYDFIVLPDVLEHIPIEKHPVLFKSLSASLNDDGSIVIHLPNPYYLAYLREHDPESLQIIDQPLYTNLLTDNIYGNGLFIHCLNSYSIWTIESDYQVIVLRKKPPADYSYGD